VVRRMPRSDWPKWSHRRGGLAILKSIRITGQGLFRGRERDSCLNVIRRESVNLDPVRHFHYSWPFPLIPESNKLNRAYSIRKPVLLFRCMIKGTWTVNQNDSHQSLHPRRMTKLNHVPKQKLIEYPHPRIIRSALLSHISILEITSASAP
jgi:hypothetical protein